MSRSTATLKWLLLIGAAYFLAIAIVHMLRIKVPMLLVYYTMPSYGYQDRIISFLSFGWSIFMLMASIDPMKNRDAVKAILIAGLAAIFGLNVINRITDFHKFSPDIDPSVFRIETLGLSIYVAILIFFIFFRQERKGNRIIGNRILTKPGPIWLKF